MSTQGADRQGDPSLVYRAGPSILYTMVICALLAVLAVSLLGGMLLALLVPQRPHLLLAAVSLVMLIVLGGALGLLLRPSFRVTTAGVEVRGYFSAHRLSWP